MNGNISLRFYITFLASALTGIALFIQSMCAVAADPASPIDAPSLVQVWSLAALPRDVATVLGWHKPGVQGLADVHEKFNATDVVDTRLPLRRFIVGGASPTSALVAYEQGGISHSIHAVAFSLGNSGWGKVGEWSLEEAPPSLSRLLDDVDIKIHPYGLAWKRLLTQRMQKTRPARRDGPLRELNLSDNEVREIQGVARRIYPGSILNISGVVTGCPCEEGPRCLDQVWIVTHRPGQVRGLQLSRINGHWAVGIVQQWWLDFESLQASLYNSRGQYDSNYDKAVQALYERFPACTAVEAASTTPVSVSGSRPN